MAQRGLSLVELMVGIALGMFIVAGATLMVSFQLSNNRQLLLETQIQQDLRASADIIARELRRAGSLKLDEAYRAIAAPGVGPQENALANVTPIAGSSDEVRFAYFRGSGDPADYRFRLNAGALETFQGGAWQQLTDRNTMNVTAFIVTAEHEPSLRLACHRLCSDGTSNCWPTLQVRRFTIDIQAQAVHDAQVQRRLRSTVRLRNDDLIFNNPDPTGPVCP